jgi:hypothetical protein
MLNSDGSEVTFRANMNPLDYIADHRYQPIEKLVRPNSYTFILAELRTITAMRMRKPSLESLTLPARYQEIMRLNSDLRGDCIHLNTDIFL